MVKLLVNVDLAKAVFLILANKQVAVKWRPPTPPTHPPAPAPACTHYRSHARMRARTHACAQTSHGDLAKAVLVFLASKQHLPAS